MVEHTNMVGGLFFIIHQNVLPYVWGEEVNIVERTEFRRESCHNSTVYLRVMRLHELIWLDQKSFRGTIKEIDRPSPENASQLVNRSISLCPSIYTSKEDHWRRASFVQELLMNKFKELARRERSFGFSWTSVERHYLDRISYTEV